MGVGGKKIPDQRQDLLLELGRHRGPEEFGFHPTAVGGDLIRRREIPVLELLQERLQTGLTDKGPIGASGDHRRPGNRKAVGDQAVERRGLAPYVGGNTPMPFEILGELVVHNHLQVTSDLDSVLDSTGFDGDCFLHSSGRRQALASESAYSFHSEPS